MMSGTSRLATVPVEILIVEDSPTQAQRLRHVLEQAGYHVTTADNGRLALEAAQHRKPTLIISDMVMPEMDGYELCRRIKADAALADIPVILVTTLSNPKDVLYSLECGADNFIVKPCEDQFLLSQVQRIISNPELRKHDRAEMGVSISFAGKRHFINSERRQILDVLLSTYDTAVRKNAELARAQTELETLNQQLEDKMKERTASLASDIAERNRAEEALRESEARYRTIFDGAAEGILVTDAETKQSRYANPAMCRMLGYTREELLRLGLEDIRPKESLDDVVAELGAQARGEKVLATGVPCQRRDRAVFYADVTTAPAVIDGRECNVGFFVDITERKQAEDALRASENRYRRLFELAEDGILILDAVTGAIADANPFLERMLGQSREQLLGKALWDTGLLKDIVASKEAFAELQDKGYMRYEHLPLIRHDGARMDVEVVSNVYTVQDEKVIQCNIRDMTAQRQAEEALRQSGEQLRQAQRLESVGRLAGGVAHDFNNILTGIGGYTQLVVEQLAEDSPARADLQEVRKLADRASALTRQLLDTVVVESTS